MAAASPRAPHPTAREAPASAAASADEGARAVEGVLLSADYVTVGTRAWVRLWLADGARTVSVLDPTFEPYFYAMPERGVAADKLAGELLGLSASDKRPERCEVVERFEGLERVKVVRVITTHPQDVPALREKVRHHRGVASTREDDVLFVNRYLVDRDLVPLTWTRATVRPSDRVGGGLEVVAIEQERARGGDLRILAFDLEVYNPRITPDAKRDPILVITLAGSRGHREVLVKRDDASDKELVEAFVARVQQLDPDVLVTYNGDNFDWPYLAGRASEHHVRLAVGRDRSAPTIRQAGRDKAVRIAGRANVDCYQVASRDLPDVKVKTLDRVAEHLGLMRADERTMLDATHMAKLWDDKAARAKVLAYAADDAASTLAIGEHLLALQIGLGRRTYQDLSDVSRMGRGRLVDWYLLAEAHKRGLVAPSKQRDEDEPTEPFEGGVVLEPPRGIHENVVYLDFSSMYPSIMMAHNVSPETYIAVGTKVAGDVFEAPEVGHRFRASPEGFFKRVLSDLVAARRELKKKMKAEKPGSPEWRAFKVEEQATKVVTNAVYGYMGWVGARWYSIPCAEATTAWGRHFIRRVADKARAMGLEVLYGDTDSVMVRDAPQVDAFVREVNDELPLELDVAARFKVLFFTGAKKRYAGRTVEGTTIVRGLEVRRGDWCDYAKTVQNDAIEALLTDRDPEKAKRQVAHAVERLKSGAVPLADLTIYKTLTMDPESYKAKQPHAVAVEHAQRAAPDYKPTIGAKLGYVIVKGREELVTERARLVDFLGPDDVLDSEYYIENQVVPAALRVLENFGVTADDLSGRPSQKSLKDWFT